MNIESLRKITQPPAKLGDVWFTPALRIFSIYFTFLFIKLKLTHNQVTALTGITAVIAGISFAFSEVWSLITGCVLLPLISIFDCCDGELARYYKRSSLTGEGLDAMVFVLVTYSILLGLSIYSFNLSSRIFPIIAALSSSLIWLFTAYIPAFTSFLVLNKISRSQMVIRFKGNINTSVRFDRFTLRWFVWQYINFDNQMLLIVLLIIFQLNTASYNLIDLYLIHYFLILLAAMSYRIMNYIRQREPDTQLSNIEIIKEEYS